MRSLRLRYLTFSLIAVVAIACGFFGLQVFHGSTPLNKAHASSPLNPIGNWHLTVTFTANGQQSPSDIEFDPDGGNPNNIYNGQVINYTPYYGTGYWSMSGPNQFQYQFDEQILDSNGNPNGYVHVNQNATLSSNGQTYTASGTGTIFSNNGTVLSVNNTRTYATRA